MQEGVKQAALETHFLAEFSSTQVVMENAGTPSAEQYDEFVRFSVQFGDAKNIQIGGGGRRYPGIVMVQIFQREGVGIARGMDLAALISALYTNTTISGVVFWVPYVSKVPFTRDGWFQIQVTAPFYYDEVE